MKGISYMDIHNEGVTAFESDMFVHLHDLKIPIRYDSNLIAFKRMPNVQEFSKTEKYLHDYHLERNQKHLKFTFPPNEKIEKEVLAKLISEGYDIGFTELYKIVPQNFPKVKKQQDIEVVHVSDSGLEDFLTLSYQQDSIYGSEFAASKREVNKLHFKDSKFWQVLAYYVGIPAGGLEIIIQDQTVEIDGLFVLPEFQRKKIAAHMQQFVMESFPDKTVILVADGEDTPKEMYQKQNYQYVGYKYEAIKVFGE
ncbi:N-acetyltransferase [Niallia circulans]|uniref:N-acetyltransferase n=1 Tax=Niallia circulans TaxID=1397 RepID=A0A553SF13_NIACI|nr:GNAT family N-acetyltransferase [Niallia circulans]TRZ35595.1 N-acetyltransferase [Niallia circulans]